MLNRAKTNNPQVNAQKNNVESKRELSESAWKNLVLPPVNLSNEDKWKVVKKYGVGLEEFSVTLPIYAGGRDLNRYKKAKTELDIAQKDSILTELGAQEAAVAEYFAALNAKKQIEITDKTIEALEKQKERVYDLYKNGKLVPKSEVLKIEATIENNKGLNLENEHKYSASMGQLARLLGYSIDSGFNLEDFNPTQFLNTKAHLKNSTKKDVKNTILGEKEQLKLDNASYNVKLAKADLYPVLYTKYTYYYRDTDGHGNIYKRNENVVSLGFRWILTWGATLDNVRASEYAYEKAKIEYEDNIQGISLDMKNKLSEIKALYGKSLATEKSVALLEENLQIDSMRYENELISTFDYLNSVNTLREAQENYYAIQRQLVLTIIEYENLYK